MAAEQEEIKITIDSGLQADLFGAEPVPVEIKRTCNLIKPTLDDYARDHGIKITDPDDTDNNIFKEDQSNDTQK